MATLTDEQDPALCFSVSYTLREYLSIVQAAYGKRGKPAGGLPWLVRPAAMLVASCLFVIKKRRMPVCHFRIDSHEIQPETADDTLRILWSEVLAVHAYTQGYLVEKAKGPCPCPTAVSGLARGSGLRLGGSAGRRSRMRKAEARDVRVATAAVRPEFANLLFVLAQARGDLR